MKTQYTFLIISHSFFLRMRNVADKSCTENQNTLLCSVIFFSKIEPLWDVEKYCTEGQATHDNMAHVPCYTRTHSQYVMFIERISVSRYTCIVRLFRFSQRCVWGFAFLTCCVTEWVVASDLREQHSGHILREHSGHILREHSGHILREQHSGHIFKGRLSNENPDCRTRPCLVLGSHSSGPHRKYLFRKRADSLWFVVDKLALAHVFPRVLHLSPQSVSFHQCSAIILIYMFLLSEGRKEEAWEPANK
jgi:hypothetical protein